MYSSQLHSNRETGAAGIDRQWTRTAIHRSTTAVNIVRV